MIVGMVDPYQQGYVSLTVRGPGGQEATLRFLVDSGFNGSLLLPEAVVQALGLEPRSSRVVRVADDREINVLTYRARVIWDGEDRAVNVLASGSEPLLGMSIAVGYNISINMVDGGRVALTRLPPDAMP